FPIAELGNCSSAETCKQYCNDTTHQQACYTFGKSHGLYKQQNTQGTQRITELSTLIQTELGCDYATTCKTFCSQQENIQKCQQLLNSLIQSGACTTSKDCYTYCVGHTDACPGFPKLQRGGTQPPVTPSLGAPHEEHNQSTQVSPGAGDQQTP